MNTQDNASHNDEAAMSSGNEHFNPEVIRQYADGDENFMQELLDLTKTAIANSRAPLQQFYAEKQLAELNHWGHKMHGTASTSGLTLLAELADKLENVKTFEGPEIANLFTDIINELDTLESYLVKVSFI